MTGDLVTTRWALRPMRESDIDPIHSAECGIYEFPWSRGNFVDSLAAGHSAWLAEHNGSLAGYAVMMMGPDEAELLNISVLAGSRRQGLGSLLLGHLIERGRRAGARRMLLEVRPGNASGIALYQQFGFAQIGRRKAYYPAAGGREDALVLARPL